MLDWLKPLFDIYIYIFWGVLNTADVLPVTAHVPSLRMCGAFRFLSQAATGRAAPNQGTSWQNAPARSPRIANCLTGKAGS